MSWKSTFLSWRFYARNPVLLPTYLPRSLTPEARRLLRKVYAEEVAEMGSPNRFVRWFIIMPAWFAAMARTSWQSYHLHRPAIRKGHPQLSSAIIAWRLFVSVFVSNLPPREFFRYKFYLKTHFRHRGHYLPNWQLDPLLARARPGRKPTPLSDKLLFWQIMSKAGVPSVPVIAVVRNGSWVEGSWDSLDEARKDFVIKPLHLCRGRGIVFFDAHPENGWLMAGKRLSSAETRAHIENLSKQQDYIVQHRMQDHPVLRSFGIDGVVTVRIVTIKTRTMARPEGLIAALRLPNPRHRIPNMADQGLICRVDWNSGLTWSAEGTTPGYEALKAHPQTGATLGGIQVPFWQECKDLCYAAHLVQPTLNNMGWDLIITPEGPLLLEANTRWGGYSAQVGGTPLLRSRFPELYEEWPATMPAPAMD